MDISPEQSASPVLITAAVDAELAALRDLLASPSRIAVAGKTALAGWIGRGPAMLLATGPGVVNTAHFLTAALLSKRPSLIIQTGCAGVFRESGLGVGDVAVAACEVDVYTGLEPEDGGPFPAPLPFPLMEVEGKSIGTHYPMREPLINAVVEMLQPFGAASGFQVGKGPFITVSTITATDQRAKALYDRFKPCMEQMEGAAAAHIALLHDIPILEIRGAGNWVGNRDKSAWDIPLACRNAGKAVGEVLRFKI